MSKTQRASRAIFHRGITTSALGAILAGLVGVGSANAANEVASFYAGKQISLIISTAPGGGVDAYSRLLARHFGRHIPGQPTIVAQNMPGASGVKAANYLYNIAAKDGTVIGHVQRGTLVEPLFGNKELKFDASKVSWIGSLNTEWSVALAGGKSGLTSLQDALEREFPVAAEGPTASDHIYASVLNGVLGTRFKIISGYKGKADERFAIEQGEVAGLIGWAWSSVQNLAWQQVQSGQLKVIASLAPEKPPGLEKVPTVYDFAKSEEDRQVLDFIFGPQVLGRPHFAPPGVPAIRVAALRKAFDDTMKDPAFLADAKKGRFALDPFSGEEIERRVKALYATPPAIIERAKIARGDSEVRTQ
jgi:tripartite-type tricarboxylate transporter receptor subunit TctC